MVCRNTEDASQNKHLAGEGPLTVLMYHWGSAVSPPGGNSLGQELEADGLTTPTARKQRDGCYCLAPFVCLEVRADLPTPINLI